MITCERCGNDVFWTCDTVQLFGGYIAHFCTECRREWHVLCDAETGQESSELKARHMHYECLALGDQPVSEQEWKELAEQGRKLEQKAFALATKFAELKLESQ